MRSAPLLRAALLLTLSLIGLSGCGQPAANVDPTDAAERAQSWLRAQLQPSGLIDSFADSQPACFTYDQAVAAIALLARQDFAGAQGILERMQALQQADGSWYTAYDCAMLSPLEQQKHVGPAMWLALAAAFYETHSGGDTAYREMAQRALDWALQFQQADGGINGGSDGASQPLPWCSTEHNIDAYAALSAFGYSEAAGRVRNFLLGPAWDAGQRRWHAGRGDHRDPLDVNTWGVLALAGGLQPEQRQALAYVLQQHRSAQPYVVGMQLISVQGFDFDSATDDVWLEGTSQVVLALKSLGRLAEAEAVLAEVLKTQRPDGGVPYSLHGSHNGYFSMQRTSAVASTGWLILAIEGIDPFAVQRRLPATTRNLAGQPARLQLPLGSLALAGLLFFACLFSSAVGLITLQHLARLDLQRPASALLAGSPLLAGLLAGLLTGYSLSLALVVVLCLVALLLIRRWLAGLTAAGQLLLASHAGLLCFALLWAGWFATTLPASQPTRALLLAGLLLAGLSVPVLLIHTFERWEPLCRSRWSRPNAPLQPGPRQHEPKVCFHVACYAEPPDVLIATLNALARLRYPNYEVLVIDNNTPDPALWQPVEAHCRALGERFRFFHLHRWYGAKSGALNFALEQTATDAELVALIDSDYQVDPGFLDALVGYFDDPRLGFVQTPHDYRDWQHSRYLRMCYWEYKYAHLAFVSLNERDAAIIVGTMCVIRRAALEQIGGWARWCVTEDSESSIRLHAAGYAGLYLSTSLGRGLIPETFAGYKRQRFRWAYGPVQELKHHLRLYLPPPLRRPSALSSAQKLHFLNHGLEVLNSGVGLLLLLLGCALAGSIALQREVLPLPSSVGMAAVTLPAGWLVLRWLLHRVVLGCSTRAMLGGLLASAALSHTTQLAGVWGLFTRSIRWQRTSKFKALPAGLQALDAARAELLLGCTLLAFTTCVALIGPLQGLLTVLVLALLLKGLIYLSAPLLALLAERELRADQPAAAPLPGEAPIIK